MSDPRLTIRECASCAHCDRKEVRTRDHKYMNVHYDCEVKRCSVMPYALCSRWEKKEEAR